MEFYAIYHKIWGGCRGSFSTAPPGYYFLCHSFHILWFLQPINQFLFFFSVFSFHLYFTVFDICLIFFFVLFILVSSLSYWSYFLPWLCILFSSLYYLSNFLLCLNYHIFFLVLLILFSSLYYLSYFLPCLIYLIFFLVLFILIVLFSSLS